MTEQLKNQEDRKITIRLATLADAHRLARSRYAFRSSLNSARENEDEFVARCTLWMQERLRQDSLWRCWIAECNHLFVGNLWMQLIEKIPNPISEAEYHAYITNVYVGEEARGQGIGSMLLSAALEWAKTQDVQAVILWPTEKSRSLYARHGFGVRDDLMELMIREVEEE